jgi:hypothetical protein
LGGADRGGEDGAVPAGIGVDENAHGPAADAVPAYVQFARQIETEKVRSARPQGPGGRFLRLGLGRAPSDRPGDEPSVAMTWAKMTRSPALTSSSKRVSTETLERKTRSMSISR